ncbi:permease-like cell division protein FtsX [Granulosicoccus antarcticus]|uniref:Cell division protein FtsX n=1 Tax=Granulosicoccus antarcticus IMCC3135 TaxID=1192854 RepID=A0A2Z2NJ94_9GAMM|nr:permease-like cell division protein FtsX [Granulosicoccus antarcticus]ASJ71163.1 Cell division protein FtsX [Granulosicoccus antarcticus IMCC3135]
MTPEEPAFAAGPRWTYGKRGYALAQSLRQLRQHKFASLTTLLVLGITLALPVMLLFASSALQQLSSRSLEGESLTAYLTDSVSDLDGVALAEKWAAQGGIRDTRYISRDEALLLFQQNSDIGAAIDALGSNPLPGAIMVFPDNEALNAGAIDAIAKGLRGTDGVERVQFDLRWVKRLQAVVSLIQLVGGLLAGFLTLTALLVIGNTIRLELLRRRSEMEVASLLGASSYFMNRPILYIGALYGLLGGVVACIIAVFAFNAIQQPADDLSSLYESTFRLNMPTLSQIGIVLAVSITLGLLGALSSLYRPSLHLTQRGSSRH